MNDNPEIINDSFLAGFDGMDEPTSVTEETTDTVDETVEETTTEEVEEFDEVDEEEVEYDVNYLKQIVNGVVDNQSQIDFMISMNLKNYTLDRLSVVDRSLLEIGTYELLFTSTPTNIVINEIVEISKEYSEVDDYKTSKFNNAVLDSIAKSRK